MSDFNQSPLFAVKSLLKKSGVDAFIVGTHRKIFSYLDQM